MLTSPLCIMTVNFYLQQRLNGMIRTNEYKKCAVQWTLRHGDENWVLGPMPGTEKLFFLFLENCNIFTTLKKT